MYNQQQGGGKGGEERGVEGKVIGSLKSNSLECMSTAGHVSQGVALCINPTVPDLIKFVWAVPTSICQLIQGKSIINSLFHPLTVGVRKTSNTEEFLYVHNMPCITPKVVFTRHNSFLQAQ